MCLIFCLVIFETIPLRAETGFDYVETVRLTIHMHNSVRNVISYIEKIVNMFFFIMRKI